MGGWGGTHKKGGGKNTQKDGKHKRVRWVGKIHNEGGGGLVGKTHKRRGGGKNTQKEGGGKTHKRGSGGNTQKRGVGKTHKRGEWEVNKRWV